MPKAPARTDREACYRLVLVFHLTTNLDKRRHLDLAGVIVVVERLGVEVDVQVGPGHDVERLPILRVGLHGDDEILAGGHVPHTEHQVAGPATGSPVAIGSAEAISGDRRAVVGLEDVVTAEGVGTLESYRGVAVAIPVGLQRTPERPRSSRGQTGTYYFSLRARSFRLSVSITCDSSGRVANRRRFATTAFAQIP